MNIDFEIVTHFQGLIMNKKWWKESIVYQIQASRMQINDVCLLE